MVEGNNFYLPVAGARGDGLAVELADLAAGLGQVKKVECEIHGEATQGRDDPGLDDGELAHQKG